MRERRMSHIVQKGGNAYHPSFRRLYIYTCRIQVGKPHDPEAMFVA